MLEKESLELRFVGGCVRNLLMQRATKDIDLAIKAVNTAINRDLASGDGIDIFVVNSKGAHKIHSKKVEKIIQ